LGSVLFLLCFAAVFRQGGTIHYSGTVHYLRYTISSSLLLRFTTLVVRRIR